MAPASRNRRSAENSEESFDFLEAQRSPAKAPNIPRGRFFMFTSTARWRILLGL
jgi:hypothetical protein